MRGTKLNFGSYYMYIDGWVNIDTNPKCYPDILNDARNVVYPDNSISVILASQFFEHVSREDGKQLLEKWYKMLIPGGYLIIEVPDCTDLDKKLNDGVIDIHTYNVCKYGNSAVAEDMDHLAAYESGEFIALLQSVGFKDITRNENTSNNDKELAMRFDCKK